MKIVSILLFIFLSTGSAVAADPVRVVATLETFADIARKVGGDRVSVVAIAKPNFNPHFIEPRPTDVMRTKKADLFIHGGADLEAWRDPLLEAVGKPELKPGGAQSVNLSEGITLLDVPSLSTTRAAGDIHAYGNPHYWLDPYNGILMSETIAKALCRYDIAHCDEYHRNQRAFVEGVKNSIKAWEELSKKVKGKNFIAYHDELPYFARFLGMKIVGLIEPKPGIPPGPKHMQMLMEIIKELDVVAIVQATFYPSDAAESLQRSTGVSLFRLCQGVGEIPECKSYLDIFDYNISQILRASSENPL